VKIQMIHRKKAESIAIPLFTANNTLIDDSLITYGPL
jgi:hypothetical protein